MKTKVKMQLVGMDGNAYSVMGVFQRETRRQGWTPEEIKGVIAEAMSGDYDHLLATIMDNVEEPIVKPKLRRYPKDVVIAYARKMNTPANARKLAWVDSGHYTISKP